MGKLINKSAVVGANGMLKIAVASVKLVTGRNVQTFNSENDALKWLNEK
jgi:hypothetical protein